LIRRKFSSTYVVARLKWWLFSVAIDSKLRGCDVVALKVDDLAPGGYAADRATCPSCYQILRCPDQFDPL
jgi:hypothetical protein